MTTKEERVNDLWMCILSICENFFTDNKNIKKIKEDKQGILFELIAFLISYTDLNIFRWKKETLRAFIMHNLRQNVIDEFPEQNLIPIIKDRLNMYGKWFRTENLSENVTSLGQIFVSNPQNCFKLENEQYMNIFDTNPIEVMTRTIAVQEWFTRYLSIFTNKLNKLKESD